MMRLQAILLTVLVAVGALAAPNPLVPVRDEYVATTPAYTYILDLGPVLTGEGEVEFYDLQTDISDAPGAD